MNSNYIKSSLFIAVFQLFLWNIAGAQTKTNNTISGKVYDKSSNQPLEYATIAIINKQSGKIINGTIADVNGQFAISNIPSGSYIVDIEFIGYEKNRLDNINVTADKKSISVGTVFLSPLMQNLQNVTIVGDKPIVESKIDKIVYNAANDITSQGGAAIDVLKKVPQVTVDIDGNVELQGNANIRFLINGKPSSVFGNSLSDALASIPASQIKSVEAITSPGAKYDSQGTGGIINIILFDNNMKGVNGNINLSAGTRLENGSANFNIRHNSFGINAYFGGNAQLKSQVHSSQDRFSTDTSAKTITNLSQNSLGDFVRNGFRSGIGLDWDISKKDVITASVGYNQFGNQSSGLTSQDQLVEDYSGNSLSDMKAIRNSKSHTRISSVDWSLDYKKKFKKEGQELDILYNASDGRPNSSYTQTQTYAGQSIPFMGSSSSNPGKDRETDISIDYAHPVTKDFLIETGAKASYQNLNSIADVSVFDPPIDQFISDAMQSYHLDYTMKVYAGYLSTTFPLFHYLNIKAGARYEYSDVNIDFPNTVIPSYGTFVPSGVISHNFNKMQSLKLAYSKRIERPGYRELNPFINLSDPYNITTGNPLLKPEIGNNLELGFNSSLKKGGNVYVALIERVNTQDVKQMTTFYPSYAIGDSVYSNVSVTKSLNIGKEFNSGISASGSYPITSKLNLRGNLMITHRYIVSNLSTGNMSTGFRYRLNMNASYQLQKSLVAEVFGMYSSAAQSIQGKTPQFLIYTFAFRKMFWDKKGSLGLTCVNPFNKYVRQVTTISADSYTSSSIRKIPLRSFGISFTYKFGKMEFKKNKGEDDNNYLNNTAPGGS